MKDFEQVFKDAMAEIRHEAQLAEMSMADVCRDAGVARASPDRWKVAPKTIKAVAKMQRAINKRKLELGQL